MKRRGTNGWSGLEQKAQDSFQEEVSEVGSRGVMLRGGKGHRRREQRMTVASRRKEGCFGKEADC